MLSSGCIGRGRGGQQECGPGEGWYLVFVKALLMTGTLRVALVCVFGLLPLVSTAAGPASRVATGF